MEELLIKSELPLSKSVELAPAYPMESTYDGVAIGWPIHPTSLYLFYRYSSEHMRCCQIKADCAYGYGWEGGEVESVLENLLPPYQSPAVWVVQIGLDLEVYGNAFCEKIKSGKKIIGLKYLPARTMMRAKQGGYVQWTYKIDGDLIIDHFAEEDIIHFREPCIAGLHYSLPTWVGCEDMIELVRSATVYNASFFRNRKIPDYIIMGPLGESARSKLKSFFDAEFSGPENAHRAIVIPKHADQTIEFQKLTEDNKEGEFLKLLDGARERIITAHGVPPRMLGIVTAGQLGGGGEAEAQLWVFEQTTLEPRRRRLTAQLRPLFKEIGLTGTYEFIKMPVPQKQVAPGSGPAKPIPVTEPVEDEETVTRALIKELMR